MRFLHNPMVYDKESTVWNAVRIVVHVAPRLQFPVPSPACLMASPLTHHAFNWMNPCAVKFLLRLCGQSVRRFTAQCGNVRTDDAPGHGLSHRARGADRTLNVFDARQTRDGGDDHHQRKPEYRVIVPDFSGNTRQRSGNNPAHANGICIESCG